jgi:hypothetical protein
MGLKFALLCYKFFFLFFFVFTMSFLSSSRTLLSSRRPLVLNSIKRQFASKTVVVERELPKPPPPSRKRWLWTGIGVGALVWAVGLGAALNHQRLSSSVVHGTLFTVRYDPRVIALVGDKIDYADSWPWISGTVNHLKGKIDIAFDVKGSTGKTIFLAAYILIEKKKKKKKKN